jgi:hypothetical protein
MPHVPVQTGNYLSGVQRERIPGFMLVIAAPGKYDFLLQTLMIVVTDRTLDCS